MQKIEVKIGFRKMSNPEANLEGTNSPCSRKFLKSTTSRSMALTKMTGINENTNSRTTQVFFFMEIIGLVFLGDR